MFGTKSKKILLTGIQATGDLHLGNYLGSITNVIKEQEKDYDQKYVMIADWHSLTNILSYEHSIPQLKSAIDAQSLQLGKVLVASGVDRGTIFPQSLVKEHLELSWLLSCFAPLHWLNTMIQFKQKSSHDSSIGLYTYPILMAADILLYRTTHVPVGVDQTQHLELTSKIATRLNNLSKTDYFCPITYVASKAPKVMSLNNPLKKMSKSDTNPKSRILLTDSCQDIRHKIQKSVTDSLTKSLCYSPEQRPGVSNLLLIYSQMKEQSIEDCENQVKDLSMKQFKDIVGQTICVKLKNIRQNVDGITDQQIKTILSNGANKAREKASKNIKEIKQLFHLYI